MAVAVAVAVAVVVCGIKWLSLAVVAWVVVAVVSIKISLWRLKPQRFLMKTLTPTPTPSKAAEVAVPVYVWSLTEHDAQLVYHEMVHDDSYLQHGVQLDDGAVVLDMGANLGLFAVSLMERFERLSIHCVEPLPATFRMLRMNMDECRQRRAARRRGSSSDDAVGRAAVDDPDGHRVTLHQVGVSNASQDGQDVLFEFQPYNTVGTGVAGDPTGIKAFIGGTDLITTVRAGVSDLARTRTVGRDVVDRVEWMAGNMAGRVVLRIVGVFLLAFVGLRAWLTSQVVRCKMTTVSSLMAKECIVSVDLLKIDVEGCEELVLDGVTDKDMRAIRQVVIEVHDIDGRLARIVQRLERSGFDNVQVHQEPWAVHRLWKITSVFATRHCTREYGK